MNETMMKHLAGVRFGELQKYRGIAVYPLLAHEAGGLEYVTLGEAMENRWLTVTEVSQGGSVPELKVTSSAAMPILLLDGEELAGAKQNRVLNTTVLVPAGASIVIPVSCTERGRWSYASPAFCESGNVMARQARARKTSSVSESLACEAGFRSDQGQVWADIDLMQAASGASSATSAMRDVYRAKENDLAGAMAAFPLIADQAGLLVLLDGRPVGMDMLSRPAAYARLHAKLAKSYVMDALLAGHRKGRAHPPANEASARAFLAAAMGCTERRFKSMGLGEDCRYKDGAVAGSALVHEGTVIHAAFFHLDGMAADEPFTLASRRRSFRAY